MTSNKRLSVSVQLNRKEKQMSRFEEQPYRPSKNLEVMEDRSGVEADVKKNLLEDYNYNFGKEYKDLLIERRAVIQRLQDVETRIVKAKAGYKPPIY